MVKKASQSVSLDVLQVTKDEEKQVAFVEAGQDFIDVLFSFMTMPIGMIIRTLARDNLLEHEMGCLKNLYDSVETVALQSETCKDMLLRPRSPAEIHYSKLKLDLLDITTEYYMCKEKRCDFVSFYQTGVCQCGKPLKVVKKLPENQSSVPQDGGCVFVKSTTRFIIDDKFTVRPVSIENGKKRLEELQLTDESEVERKTENMGTVEVLKLMVCSLASKTPFSDVFTNTSPKSSRDFRDKYVPARVHQSKNHVTDHNASDEIQIKLKLVIDKPNDRVLYAEAGEDFVDLLFSFLTIPLAYFFKQCPSLPFKGSMKNLYKNIQDLPIQFFESEEMKATLLDSKLVPVLAQKTSQLLHLEEASNIRSYRTYCSKPNYSELGSNSNRQEVESGKGFVKGPSTFLVENNLSVKPFSAIEGKMIETQMNVRSQDAKTVELTVDKDKALDLMAASLVSTSALSDVFISEEQRQEGVCCCWYRSSF